MTVHRIESRHWNAPRPLPQEPQTMFEWRPPAWQAQAACRPSVIPDVWQPYGRSPVDLFYPDGPVTQDRRDAIASVCDGCPVRSECAEHGIRHEQEGFWGGVGTVVMKQARSAAGLRLDTLELDPATRQMIGTFFPPGHGTYSRYQQHVREGDDPCEACRDARRLNDAPRASAAWDHRKRTETPEERAERLAADRAARMAQTARRRRGG